MKFEYDNDICPFCRKKFEPTDMVIETSDGIAHSDCVVKWAENGFQLQGDKDKEGSN